MLSPLSDIAHRKFMPIPGRSDYMQRQQHSPEYSSVFPCDGGRKDCVLIHKGVYRDHHSLDAILTLRGSWAPLLTSPSRVGTMIRHASRRIRGASTVR
jgi:hypothetical protein